MVSVKLEVVTDVCEVVSVVSLFMVVVVLRLLVMVELAEVVLLTTVLVSVVVVDDPGKGTMAGTADLQESKIAQASWKNLGAP